MAGRREPYTAAGRMDKASLARVDAAARLVGKVRAHFVTEAVLEKADRVLLEAASDRLGHGDAPAHGARPRRAEHGRLAAPARASNPSLGPGHATRVRGVVATVLC